ncbi:N-acylglucosamine 2-epimerase-like [Mercenaria mercenaria]|uniref:N-acylglucosamine 2-epimerase-like n=1 Tax=Mercenaria mercenaria TaxID=6596 RepID=UPI00234E7A9F|nr:N-acylglucosamine 2-epimerase-like [Mercenaria mercenaria]
MAEERLEEFFKEISEDLQRTVNFWLKYSHDEEFGGFFNCLGPSGNVYDEAKHVWLQSRQIWMYARLYNEEEQFRKPEILQAAVRGAEFLQKNAKDPKTSKLCFSLTRDGRPIKIQRSIFSECFYTMAVSELHRTTKEAKYKDEAIEMFDKIIYWVREDSTDMRLGLSPLPGVSAVNSMAVPMMLLCVLDQMETMDSSMSEKYADVGEWSLKQVLAHRQREGTIILENVSPAGGELPGSAGRLTVPGHAIEAGWFLLQYAGKKNDKKLKKTAIDDFIVRMFEYGWDTEHGGLFYFLDIDGYSPVQLEWNMKLWWTHNESMIAFLMAYQKTKDLKMLEKFETLFDYCYSKHVDKENGEWTGYLNRDGSVCMDFKGGPWKGCFHVPRALLMCKQILRDILKK